MDGTWDAESNGACVAVNPYGGPPDVKSRLEVRVRVVELVVRSFHGCFDYVA
jgi:hypothetical protein